MNIMVTNTGVDVSSLNGKGEIKNKTLDIITKYLIPE